MDTKKPKNTSLEVPRFNDTKYNEKVKNLVIISILISTYLLYYYINSRGSLNRCTFIDFGVYKLWPANIFHYKEELLARYSQQEICVYFTTNTSMFIMVIVYSIWRIFAEYHRQEISVYYVFIKLGPMLIMLGLLGSLVPFHEYAYSRIGLGYDRTIGQNLFRSCLFIAFLALVIGNYIAAVFEKFRRNKELSN